MEDGGLGEDDLGLGEEREQGAPLVGGSTPSIRARSACEAGETDQVHPKS